MNIGARKRMNKMKERCATKEEEEEQIVAPNYGLWFRLRSSWINFLIILSIRILDYAPIVYKMYLYIEIFFFYLLVAQLGVKFFKIFGFECGEISVILFDVV